MSNALFINGIFKGVLEEIIQAQHARQGGDFFLQPYKGMVIRFLKKYQPTVDDPIRLYISTTENLSQICYTAEIVQWEDKRELSEKRREEVAEILKRDQPGEADYFMEFDRNANKAVNLVTIRSLKQLDSMHSTSLLCKASDDLPLKKRTRAGGWSEVYDIGDLLNLPVETWEQHESQLVNSITHAATLSDDVLYERLNSAERMPEKVQVVSVGFRRNPNVIIAVQRRANGICEQCKKVAPFLRRSDGTPYLEIHHWKPLSQGGRTQLRTQLPYARTVIVNCITAKAAANRVAGGFSPPAPTPPFYYPQV